MADEITNQDLMEAILGLNEKINGIDGKTDHLRNEMGRRFDTLDTRLKEQDLRFNSVEAK